MKKMLPMMWAWLCFALCLPVAALASDILGGTVSYEFISPGVYRVDAYVYFDCQGLGPRSTIDVGVSAPSCGLNVPQIVSLPLVQQIEISDVCPGQATQCAQGSFMGVKQGLYSGQVTFFGSGCAEYLLSLDYCCRAAATNLGFNSLNLYSFATAYELNGVSNSSPLITNKPVLYVCQNDTTWTQIEALDPDGDSLAFSLAPVMQAQSGSTGSSINYPMGFSATHPFGQINTVPTTIDPVTGILRFRPPGAGLFQLVVQIEEYRKLNGTMVKVGSVRRDAVVVVLNCGSVQAPPPGFTVIATSASAHPFPAGTTTCLPVALLHPVPGAQVAFASTLAQVLPDATLTVDSSGASPVLTLCWQPDSTVQHPAPYPVTIYLDDDGCPRANTRTLQLQLVVPGQVGIAEKEKGSTRPSATIISPAGGVFPQQLVLPQSGALRVFNLSGQLVYQATEYVNNWNGGSLPAGMYFYQSHSASGRQVQKGYVYLLR